MSSMASYTGGPPAGPSRLKSCFLFCAPPDFGGIQAGIGYRQATEVDMMRYALIATSEPRTARMMSELSRQEGLEPVVVRGGAEARVILERNGPPALLITELSLTRADGFELSLIHISE